MKSNTILLVEDDLSLLQMMVSIFEKEGYTQVLQASDGEEALILIRKKLPDMVITDVMMPGMDGFELLQEIRSLSNIPVMLLTARNDAEDRISGFELGADDYLAKPFLPKELLLRVDAILNRTYGQEKRIITLPSCVVDLDQALVKRNGKEDTLTAKEYTILAKLLENKGRIVTVGALCQCLCGEIWQGYEGTLMTHIRHLREKIEEDPSNPQALHTIKGLGYRLDI